jgi:hypothetical protein
VAILPMPTTQFLYIDGKPNANKELVINNTISIAAEYYPLPQHIIFEMRKLGHSVFGETIVDARQKNRIKLNIDLGLRETVYVLTHEVIHLSQITTGQLAMGRNGSVIWDHGYIVDKNKLSKLSYKQYMELPWEADVVKKQQFLLEKLHKK